MDNLEEMDKLLERYNLVSLNKEDTENKNRPNRGKKVETMIKNLPTKKGQRSNGFMCEFCQTFIEEPTPILLYLFQNITEEGTLPSSFYETTITLMLKSDKYSTKKKKIMVNKTDEHRCKNRQQNNHKQKLTTHKNH